MTKEQVEVYEYCQKHIKDIKKWKENFPIGKQKYGCSSNSPQIEHTLERVHREMRSTMYDALTKAIEAIEYIIEKT